MGVRGKPRMYYSHLAYCTALFIVVSLKQGNFRLPPRIRRDLRPSGSLSSVLWLFLTDVSEQPIGPNVKGQESITKKPEYVNKDCLLI
jgi:hypothetical protein